MNLVFACLLALSVKGQLLQQLPVRSFHGLGSSCAVLAGRDAGLCVETGAGAASMTMSMVEQATVGCNALLAEAANLQNGFYMIGYSQGGLIARHIFHRCEPINRFVRRMVFVGTPHLGVGSGATRLLQAADPSGSKTSRAPNSVSAFKERFLRSSEYTTYGRGVPAFLADVNSIEWDPLYANLDFVVNFMSKRESVVRPASSTAMGASYFGGNSLQDATTVPYFSVHANGVGRLFMTGKLWNCLSDGPHNRFTGAEARLVFGILMRESPQATSYSQSALLQLARFLQAYPNYCNGRS